MSVIAGDGAWRTQSRVSAFCATWLPSLLVVAFGVIVRHLVVANTDVSWGFTLAEKLLAGERPYVDFIEVNPPASIYLYLPAVVIARWTGLTPELVMDGLVFILIGGSLCVASRILLRAQPMERFDTAKLLAMVLTILVVLPGQIFAEREHVALVLFLPMLCVMLTRAYGVMPTRGQILVAGLGAGAMIVLKPHLALGVAAAIATAAWSARSWRVLVAAENWIVCAVLAVYGATTAVLFPEFLSETVPIVRTVYLPLRRTLMDLIINPRAVSIWVLTLLALALIRRAERYDRLYGILLAASVGFAGAYFVQGKGWPYHAYPMLALGFIALACAMSERRATPRILLERGGWAVAASLLAAMTFSWMNLATTLTSLEAPIRRIKPHPTMLTISLDIAFGHPLVRAVEGTWVGRVCSMWITGGALWRRAHQQLTAEENERIDRYAAFDRAMLIDALRNRKPDVIIIERQPVDFETWARADAEISALLEPYQEAVSTPETLVLRRAGP